MPRLKATNRVVKTDVGDITVKKLPLGAYADLLRALDKMPLQIAKIVTGNDTESLRNIEKMVVMLKPVIIDAIPEFCEVLAIVTDKDKDFFMKEAGLDDAIEVFVVALELNNYSKIVDLVKKVAANKQGQTSKSK